MNKVFQIIVKKIHLEHYNKYCNYTMIIYYISVNSLKNITLILIY